ncbi:MAG: SDR family NAD(P)-dependent oxidoreductase [Novosphingobium sp.]|uniref:SDR family NAD(P)-dependent oxidoreductase n=1 Tax=Novosphingobium sp. TaxID=1874826 RepID=UPI003B9A8D1D
MTDMFQTQLSVPSSPVIVTGGASGIGLATAQALAAVGRPVALWDINGDAARNAAQQIEAERGVRAFGIAIDLRDLSAIPTALAATRTALGPAGGLVHSAGTVDTDSIDGLTPESWDSGIAIHLRALAFMVKEMRADMAAQQGSAVVAVTSINATLGNAINPVYSAGKGGLLSLVRSLADRLARDGIRINSVSPGQIVTPMTRPAIDNLPEGWFEKRILLERLGRPEEVARAIRFLLSAEASYITGAELVVDGGNISSQRV